MMLVALLPLVWAVTGLLVVARLSGLREPQGEETPRIHVTDAGNLRPAA